MFRRSAEGRPRRICPFLSSELGTGGTGRLGKAETASPAARDSNELLAAFSTDRDGGRGKDRNHPSGAI